MLAEQKTKIMNLLDTLYKEVEIGVDKNSSRITFLISSLDTLTDELVQEYGYTPRELIKLGGSFGSEKVKDLNNLKEAMKKNPALGLILGVNAMCDNLGNKLRAEIGAPAMDSAYSGTLYFYIPCDDIGNIFSSFMSPQEKKDANAKIRENLVKLGFAWEDIDDIPSFKNYGALERYLTTNGIHHICCELFEGEMRKVDCRMNSAKYVWYEAEKKPEPQPSKTLDEADVYNIKKDIKEYMHALSFFEMMNDTNLMIGLFRSYLSSVENRLEQPLKIAQAVNQEHEKSRTENVNANQYEAELGKAYFMEHNKDLSCYFAEMERRLRKCMKELTFSPLDIFIQEHGCLKLKCVPDPFTRKDFQINPSLDAKWDEMNHSYEIYYTEENKRTINETLTKYLPHAEVREYHVNENNVIRSFDIVDISFVDLITLFDQVHIEDNDDEEY